MCEHPLETGIPCGNPVCGWSDRYINCVHAACERTGSIKVLLEKFKYDARFLSWAPILGRVIVGWLELHSAPDTYGLILPNPTHADRFPRHTEAMAAAAIAEDTTRAWPWDDPSDPALVKTTPTTPSAASGTSWKAKKAAADELWTAITVQHPERARGRRVLIVDDIATTLLQLNVVAGLLKRAGAATVESLVIARSVRGGRRA